jgi:hypothetical protein
MKKIFLFLALIFAVSFSSCTDLTEEDELFETHTIDKDDVEVDGEDEETDPDASGL